jgi:hypothetical protein
MADHDHVAAIIADEGGEFNRRWSYRVAVIAQLILAARARLESEDLKRRRDEIEERRRAAGA